MGASSYPGHQSAEMLSEMGRYVIAEPYPFALDLERCEGMWLGTADGQRIFDWGGVYGSKLIGHNHPRLCEPDYLQRLCRAANNKVANPDLLARECLDYYRPIHSLAPDCMKNPRLEVYVVNSGAEAVENMLKYFIVVSQGRGIWANGWLSRRNARLRVRLSLRMLRFAS